jgi:hypothetical protein
LANAIVIGSELAKAQAFQFSLVSAQISLQTHSADESPWCSTTSSLLLGHREDALWETRVHLSEPLEHLRRRKGALVDDSDLDFTTCDEVV